MFQTARRVFYPFNKKNISRGALVLLGGAIIYPQYNSRFDLYYDKENSHFEKIIDNCPHIKWGYFFPTFYLGNGILQGLFGSMSKHFDPNIGYDEQLIDLPCGTKIALHWAKHKETLFNHEKKHNDKHKLLVVVPGLTASSSEPYIKNLVAEAMDYGYKVVVYHPRGFQAQMGLPKEGFVDPVEDFKFAVEKIIAIYPDSIFCVSGHSYGANTLVNYLGRYKDIQPFSVAASVANPFDFMIAGKVIQHTFSDKYLNRSSHNHIKRNIKVWENAPSHMDIDLGICPNTTSLTNRLEKALSTKSMIDFDNYLTCKYMGYKTNFEYYDGISSKKNLPKVNIPLLCMNSRDDPIIHHHSIPVDECIKNKNTLLLVTNTGGHVGWFSGVIQPKRWFPKPVMEFLDATINEYHLEPRHKLSH